MSNFREIDNFSTLHEVISKTVKAIGIKLSPACSSFNSVDTILHVVKVS